MFPLVRIETTAVEQDRAEEASLIRTTLPQAKRLKENPFLYLVLAEIQLQKDALMH